jgi:hypothetical protein
MQKPNPSVPSKKMNREEFLREAATLLEPVRQALASLHGEPPCMFAIDSKTVASWSEAKREETLVALRKAVAQADAIVYKAEQERTALWERSEAQPEDRALPPVVLFKSIQEDLEVYECVLKYVRALPHGS